MLEALNKPREDNSILKTFKKEVNHFHENMLSIE